MSFIGLIFILVIYGGLFLYAIAEYVLNSLGLYGIAKKRDISLAGLAWLPVANLWVLGSVIDSYEESKEEHFKKWRILLPVLMAVVAVTYILIYVLYFVMYFAMFGTMAVETNAEEISEESMGLFFIVMMVILVMVVLLALVMAAVQALNYIAIYKAYENIAPKKAIKYLVLSVAVPLGQGICMLRCKNLMPERTPFDDVSKDAPVDDYQFDNPVRLTEATQETQAAPSDDIDPDSLV